MKKSIAQTLKEIVERVGVEMTVSTKEQLERVALGNNWTYYEWLVERVVRVVIKVIGVCKVVLLTVVVK